MADTLTFQSGITGRAASLGYQFVDTAGAAIGSRITSGISEVFANVGDYIVTGVTIPSNAVAVYWDDSGNADNHALEQLLLPSKALTNVTAWTVAITGNITGNLSGSVGSVTGAVGSIASDGISNESFQADAITAYAIAEDAANEFADALLNRDMSVGTDSGSTTFRTPRQAFRFLRNKWSISGTTLTVTKEDDSTSSWTSTVSTNASADPVVGNDPA